MVPWRGWHCHESKGNDLLNLPCILITPITFTINWLFPPQEHNYDLSKKDIKMYPKTKIMVSLWGCILEWFILALFDNCPDTRCKEVILKFVNLLTCVYFSSSGTSGSFGANNFQWCGCISSSLPSCFVDAGLPLQLKQVLSTDQLYAPPLLWMGIDGDR